MSDTADFTIRAALAQIDRNQAKTGKLIAEQFKLDAEHSKLFAEQRKLAAETDKLNREHGVLPWRAAVALMGIGGALVGATVGLMRWAGL